MLNQAEAQTFEDARPNLRGLAYRILGSLTDAEDAVQDTFLKWQNADRSGIEKPAAWLTTTCTHRCLDLLRAAHRTRVDYVGAWLPEPIHTPIDNDAESRVELASSLTTAFLLMLERLTPKERAAYLLHDIFDVSYPEVAATLHMQESACRKLVSRAKANIDQDKVRHTMPLDRQDEFLAAFQTAVRDGTTTRLTTLLSNDIQLSVDSGGKVSAPTNILYGKDRVLAFVAKGLRKYWRGHHLLTADINGARGIVIEHAAATTASVAFAYDQAGNATDIYIMRNPDKLTNLADLAIHPRSAACHPTRTDPA